MDVLADRIQHVIVLMLENRSFDCLLGRLYPSSDSFHGLTGSEFNLDPAGARVGVWSSPASDPQTMTIPTPDPGELFTDINTQIFGMPAPADTTPATMAGFASSYVAQAPAGTSADTYDPRAVMHFFTPAQVPVISQLASAFAVCDQWHASAPCQTWPNRFFVHSGTAAGYENNSPVHFPYRMPTVFSRFDAAGMSDAWRIYFHDVPQSLTLSDLWGHLDRFRLYAQFRDDAASGALPAYSFIEPRYFPDVDLPNDQHPPHVVTLGEQLIADVYNCIRGGPAWEQTLLIVTYDEHGGCYDHVAPPAAVPPEAPVAGQVFRFDRYGIRVPAVIVSPYIPAGTILRAPAGTRPFDHTSIIATLRKRFDLGDALTARDASAPDLSGVLSLQTPDNLGPPRVDAEPYSASPGEVARARQQPVNAMQAALTRLAAHLPDLSQAPDPQTAIAAHIEGLAQAPVIATTGDKVSTPPDTLATRGDALHFIKQKLQGVFGAF
ncbi:MAG TPA: alkaline phosphatase family protein [Steroidobacteraceae bacterium]|nr:alkaline phosphatase family protein [Steroidobacteraceae bacterium]